MKNTPRHRMDTRRSPCALILPLLLTGCTAHTEPPPTTPQTQQTVDSLIATALASQTRRGSQASSGMSPTAVAIIPQPPGLHHVKYTGTPPAQPVLATRSGKNQTLPVAVQTIAPPGWHIVLSQELKQQSTPRVSWEGGDQWPWVLEKLANQYHLNITIMWASQQVTVDKLTAKATGMTGKSQPVTVPPVQSTRPPATPVSSPAQSAKPSAAPVASPVKSASPAPAPVSPPVKSTSPSPSPAPAPVTIWRAETGQTLKDVLFTWAATADCQGKHWTVDWVTPVNYRIDAPLSFTGSWRDALNGIFDLYRNAATPLYAGTATAQCILKVDSKPVQ